MQTGRVRLAVRILVVQLRARDHRAPVVVDRVPSAGRRRASIPVPAGCVGTLSPAAVTRLLRRVAVERLHHVAGFAVRPTPRPAIVCGNRLRAVSEPFEFVDSAQPSPFADVQFAFSLSERERPLRDRIRLLRLEHGLFPSRAIWDRSERLLSGNTRCCENATHVDIAQETLVVQIFASTPQILIVSRVQ